MKSTILFLALFSSLGFFSCNPAREEQNSEKRSASAAEMPDSRTHNEVKQNAAAEEKGSVLQQNFAQKKEETIQLLQGKWQSVEDSKSIIEFKGSDYLSYYDDEILEKMKFSIEKACPDEKVGSYGAENMQYLVVEDMCWIIEGVDANSLELTYTGRGNHLPYKKLKN